MQLMRFDEELMSKMQSRPDQRLPTEEYQKRLRKVLLGRKLLRACAKLHLNVRVRHSGAEDKTADAAKTVDSHLCRHLERSETACTGVLEPPASNWAASPRG